MTTREIGIYVTEVIECPECLGNQIIRHPAWASYWNELGEKGLKMTADQDAAWMVEKGFLNEGESLPPEELECDECLGHGKIRGLITLQEALEKIGLYDMLRSFSAHLNGGEE